MYVCMCACVFVGMHVCKYARIMFVCMCVHVSLYVTDSWIFCVCLYYIHSRHFNSSLSWNVLGRRSRTKWFHVCCWPNCITYILLLSIMLKTRGTLSRIHKKCAYGTFQWSAPLFSGSTFRDNGADRLNLYDPVEPWRGKLSLKQSQDSKRISDAKPSVILGW